MNAISELFELWEREYAGKNAYQYIDSASKELVKVTFHEYISDVRSFAQKLYEDFGQVKGKHFGILANNSYEYIVCYMGIIYAQGVAVVLNCQERQEVLADELAYADVDVLFTDARSFKKYQKLIEVKAVCNYDLSLVHAKPKANTAIKESDSDLDQTAFIVFTSGTTGKNKAVTISVRNILAFIEYSKGKMMEGKQLVGADVLLGFLVLPLYHVAGLNNPLMFNAIGEPLFINSSLMYWYREMETVEPVFMMAPPILVKELFKKINKGQYDNKGALRLLVSVGAVFDSQMLELFDQNNILVLNTYAMTETNGTGAFPLLVEKNETRRKSSVGIGHEVCQFKIVDGEVCVKGAAVTKGYYKDEEANAIAFDKEGWFHSGDLGYLDEEGYLFLTGRKKNLIILDSGENVSPEELELLLLKNRQIKECLVKEKDSKICAEISCDKEAFSNIKKWIQEMNRELASYQRISIVEYREEPFQYTSLGKIKRV